MWDGVLRKKQSERTTYELIREKFLRKIPPCGIVATFMQKDLTSDQPKTVFEYLDKDKFGKANKIQTPFNFNLSRGIL